MNPEVYRFCFQRGKYKSFYGKTPSEVEAKRDAYYEGRSTTSLGSQKYTTEAWLWKWFDHIKEDLKPATEEGYRYTAKLICRSPLGSMDIKQVLAYDVENFLRQLKNDGYSSSMISKARGMLSSAFKAAEANNLIEKNPVALGHADINMTQHYLHMQEPQRQAAIEKFSAAFSTAEG